MELHELIERFKAEYGDGDVRLFSAAGRVNLIGEHIDYCGGPVFPAALNLRCVVAVRKRSDSVIRLRATTIGDKVELDIGKLDSYRDLPWGDYQAGVAYTLQQAGFTIVGCDMLFDATVPFGSGLSSSASIEVATAYALNVLSAEAGGKSADKAQLAVLCQKSENEYNGVNCGIMDQFASAMGKKDHAILLDCKTLAYRYVPLQLGEYSLVIANCNKKRALGDSKYNERRAETEEALEKLKTVLPDITCLADVTPEMFEQHKTVLDGKVRDRAEHVVYECARVNASVAALDRGDLRTFGRLLNESHASLKDLYEVTGPELDALSGAARAEEGCIGSRMTGAGFGGCTVSLVEKSRVPAFIESVGRAYERATGLKASFYDTSIEDGAQELLPV